MENRGFDEVVKAIKDATDATNKVLEAADLQRHAGPPTRLTGQQKAELLAFLIGCLTFLGFLWIVTSPFH